MYIAIFIYIYIYTYIFVQIHEHYKVRNHLLPLNPCSVSRALSILSKVYESCLKYVSGVSA